MQPKKKKRSSLNISTFPSCTGSWNILPFLHKTMIQERIWEVISPFCCLGHTCFQEPGRSQRCVQLSIIQRNGGDVGRLRACDSSKAFGLWSGQMIVLVGHWLHCQLAALDCSSEKTVVWPFLQVCQRQSSLWVWVAGCLQSASVCLPATCQLRRASYLLGVGTHHAFS